MKKYFKYFKKKEIKSKEERLKQQEKEIFGLRKSIFKKN